LSCSTITTGQPQTLQHPGLSNRIARFGFTFVDGSVSFFLPKAIRLLTLPMAPAASFRIVVGLLSLAVSL